MRPQSMKRNDTVEMEAAAAPPAEEDWRPKPPPPEPPPKKKSPVGAVMKVVPYALFVAVAFLVVAVLQSGVFGGALDPIEEAHRAAVEQAAGLGDEPGPGPNGKRVGAAKATKAGKSAPKPSNVAVGAPRTSARGKLTLVTDQPVKVFVDGTERGTTPLTELDVEAGEHLLRLVHPTEKARSRELIVEVPEGGTLKLDEKAP